MAWSRISNGPLLPRFMDSVLVVVLSWHYAVTSGMRQKVPNWAFLRLICLFFLEMVGFKDRLITCRWVGSRSWFTQEL